ncbi:MAG: phosphonate C-P lyase system protein PhnH [Pseudomonadota bacterium]
MQASIDYVGFANAISESQASFRSVMEALSRPGRAVTLPVLPASPTGFPAGMAAIALTLTDYETPVWFDEKLRAIDEVRRFIAFHTNAPVISEPSEASFAFSLEAKSLPDLGLFAQGSLEFPDRSTTLVVEVASLTGGLPIKLQGPGIESIQSIEPTSLPADFAERLTHNRELFPCGVDIILSAGETIVGLPRSVRVLEG